MFRSVNAPTPEQLSRTTRDWSKIAKSPVTLEYTNGVLYAYGSEIACLRLHYTFREAPANAGIRVNFSKNLDTWYFSKNL